MRQRGLYPSDVSRRKLDVFDTAVHICRGVSRWPKILQTLPSSEMLAHAKHAVQVKADVSTNPNWEYVSDAKPVEQNVSLGAKLVR
jgi:hypothetical protein